MATRRTRFRRSALASRPRKAPTQERSRQLVEALMQATARILEREGWDALTTNRVASEAGVSVGSLYQYFPNRDALVSALVEGWAEDMGDRFTALNEELSSAPIERCIHRLVNEVLEVTRSDAPLHRSVLLQLPGIGALEFFERFNRRVTDQLAEWISLRRDELEVDDPSLTAHVIVTSLDALTDHATLLRPELLVSQRFARELERLVAGCLGFRAGAPTPPSRRRRQTAVQPESPTQPRASRSARSD
ncbi:MAG: TetR/AcrR family transcriptional regulator [Archangium sp.]|nr:TetR/AcrR family transcriptional regulator [Archangium sp.]